jgi:hypothetical protein
LIGQLVYDRGAEDKEIGRWGYRGMGNMKSTFLPCSLCVLRASALKFYTFLTNQKTEV